MVSILRTILPAQPSRTVRKMRTLRRGAGVVPHTSRARVSFRVLSSRRTGTKPMRW